jgi:pimeloyl-ACP methyl ester carboxylesterase
MAVAATTSLEEKRVLLERRFPQWLATLPSGARVAVREHGQRASAPTLVLLHGISSGAASWLPAVLALSNAQHVIAWDAPGYGHSTPLAQPAPVAADYAQRLHELLQVLGLRRCVLAGHSLGALMACSYAAREDKVTLDRLVLVSPARGYANDAQQAERVRRERGEALRSLGVAGLAAGIDQRLLSPRADAPAREWVRWNTARLHPQGYLQAVEMLCASELAAVPSDLPVEVHCGEADVVTPPAACAQAARALGARFHTIADAGHASPVEQPAAVAHLLAQALQQPQEERPHA